MKSVLFFPFYLVFPILFFRIPFIWTLVLIAKCNFINQKACLIICNHETDTIYAQYMKL